MLLIFSCCLKIMSLTSSNLVTLDFGDISLLVRHSEMFVFYATFIANENSKLRLRQGDTVLDFGANVGDFTVKAASSLRNTGRLIAIEPNHENVEIMKANLELNNIKDVTIIEGAISENDGFAYFNASGSVGSKIELQSAEHLVRVKTYSMETFLSETDLQNKTNLKVKMDIEGAEKDALRNDLFLSKIKEISTELHGDDNVELIPRLLKSNGFEVSYYGIMNALKETVKALTLHPIDFFRIEHKSNYLAIKGLLGSLHSNNPIPSINNSSLKMIYGRKK